MSAPDSKSVARRALAQIALGLRGLLETDDSEQSKALCGDLLPVLIELGVADILDDAERSVLSTPHGSLDGALAGAAFWSAEGAVLLVWALGAPLPPHNDAANRIELAVTYGVLNDQPTFELLSRDIRPRAALFAMKEELRNVARNLDDSDDLGVSINIERINALAWLLGDNPNYSGISA